MSSHTSGDAQRDGAPFPALPRPPSHAPMTPSGHCIPGMALSGLHDADLLEGNDVHARGASPPARLARIGSGPYGLRRWDRRTPVSYAYGQDAQPRDNL